ncbi:MAG: hypothetical protein ACFFF9_13830 [Candidatus Thorarchaeota archaeon]
MIEWIVYYLAYLGAGVTLKMGDDLLDELDRPQLAWYPLAISGVLFGYLMTISEWDLVLLTSIVIAVLASGKVNRPQFIVGFVLIFATLALLGVPLSTDWLSWTTLLIILFLAAVLDEKGNDWVDKEYSPRAYGFFKYRFTLKLVALALVIPWPLFLPTGIGLWVFDFGYETSGWLVRKQFTT